jgi:hypothetical protein
MAPKKTPLRAVPDAIEVVPVVAKPLMSVSDAAESGTRLDELRAMRAVLARAIDSDTTSPRDLAALTRRQMEISRDIESLRIEEAEEAKKAAESNVTDQQWRPAAI